MAWGRAEIQGPASRHVAAGVLIVATAVATAIVFPGDLRWVVAVSLGVLVWLAVGDVHRAERMAAIREAQQREAEAAEQARQAALRYGQARLRRLWDSNIIGVIHSNAAGDILDANDFVLRMLGYDRADLEAGRIRWKELTPEAFLAADETGIAEALKHGACTPYEKAYVDRHGRVVPVLIGYALVEQERSDFICFVLDLTEQKRSQAAARAAAERAVLLESERAARAAAERESRAKDEFVATLSHELRTPLNAILGFAQLAQRPSQRPEQQRSALEVIERNTRMLTQIIADLLDVSRLVTGKLHIELAPVDLGAAIDDAVASVRHAADAKGVALVTTIDAEGAMVSGDAARLQQVVWNLVSNAIKFTPRGGRVEVSMTPCDSEVRVVVSDTGEGLDPAFVPHLFERFRQAESSTSRRHGGLGLGLSIVKTLVEMHGGAIDAASEGPGLGARFTVTLPRVAPATYAEPPASGFAASALAGASVLVVDDEPDARDLVRRLLEEHGAVVVTAASAAEALDALAARRPDVMVSDIGMPGVDGYDLIRRVRAGDAAPDVPAVALTAYARPEDRTRALCAGYQAHLCKPVDPQEMLAAVAGLVALESGAS